MFHGISSVGLYCVITSVGRCFMASVVWVYIVHVMATISVMSLIKYGKELMSGIGAKGVSTELELNDIGSDVQYKGLVVCTKLGLNDIGNKLHYMG